MNSFKKMDKNIVALNDSDKKLYALHKQSYE